MRNEDALDWAYQKGQEDERTRRELKALQQQLMTLQSGASRAEDLTQFKRGYDEGFIDGRNAESKNEQG